MTKDYYTTISLKNSLKKKLALMKLQLDFKSWDELLEFLINDKRWKKNK